MIVSVIIPYVQTRGSGFEELRYALRSIERNLKLNAELDVVIIGDCPSWVRNVRHIEIDRDAKAEFTNCFDINRKMSRIINDQNISDQFIYTYDDIYFLKPVGPQFFDRRICVRELDERRRTESLASGKFTTFRKLIWKTFDALRAQGCRQIYNYETHLPRAFDKFRMQEVFNTYAPTFNRLLFSSLYFNHFYRAENPKMLVADETKIKAGFYGDPDPLSFPSENEEGVKQLFSEYVIANHNDEGLSPALAKTIMERFPDKSKYEE